MPIRIELRLRMIVTERNAYSKEQPPATKNKNKKKGGEEEE